jgi:hypothetical protein
MNLLISMQCISHTCWTIIVSYLIYAICLNLTIVPSISIGRHMCITSGAPNGIPNFVVTFCPRVWFSISRFYTATVYWSVCTNPGKWMIVYKFERWTKSLKIPRGQSESVYRRTDSTMAQNKSTKGQTTIYNTYTWN